MSGEGSARMMEEFADGQLPYVIASLASLVTSRETTASEATGPNTPSSARSIAISARQSPLSDRTPEQRCRTADSP
jgi:hypothetical protein